MIWTIPIILLILMEGLMLPNAPPLPVDQALVRIRVIVLPPCLQPKILHVLAPLATMVPLAIIIMLVVSQPLV